MGREARATAKLTREEQQSRNLARIAKSVRSLQTLYDALYKLPDRDAILEELRPHLTFPVSGAQWRLLRTRLGLTP